MDQIRGELLYISRHLNVKDYQNLRYAMISSLPVNQTVTLSAFKESVDFKKRYVYSAIHADYIDYYMDISVIMKLESRYLTASSFFFLIETGQNHQLKTFASNSGIIGKRSWRQALTEITKKLLINLSEEFILCVLEQTRPTDEDYEILLEMACIQGFKRLASLCLTSIQQYDINPCLINLAAQHGHLEIAKILLSDKRVDVTFDNNHIFMEAVYSANIPLVQLLLSDSRVDPSDNNNEAIELAIKLNDPQLVYILLSDDRVDPTVDNYHVVMEALKIGNFDIIVRLLNDKRVRIRSKTHGYYPIY
ncbi:hypothetical protein HK103_003097 [Boothiomyces macroporosus]|uniref:Ankyrin repeat protein n=1 Tax=Boothiomyces macroporosus TaxID=261099 RepID=A0AAD5Y4C6_9FUNG|nr:hypothetical protein HK103_003097 [Boothiomyces macroporosus]